MNELLTDTGRDLRGLAYLLGYFVLLAFLLYFSQMGQLAWLVLLLSAVAWFGMEARKAGDRKRLLGSMKIGAFLLVFDFAFENSGWVLGLWQTKSALAVGVVPVEVMGIAFFGGTAWATYVPRRFDFRVLTRRLPCLRVLRGIGRVAADKAGALRLQSMVDRHPCIRILFSDVGAVGCCQVQDSQRLVKI